jgi:hypothetical protein
MREVRKQPTISLGLDRQRMLDDLDAIEQNTRPSYSTLPDPPDPDDER